MTAGRVVRVVMAKDFSNVSVYLARSREICTVDEYATLQQRSIDAITEALDQQPRPDSGEASIHSFETPELDGPCRIREDDVWIKAVRFEARLHHGRVFPIGADVA